MCSELMLFNHRPASATRKSHPAGDNDQDRHQETVPKSHLASWTAEADLKTVRKPSSSSLKMREMLRPAAIYFCQVPDALQPHNNQSGVCFASFPYAQITRKGNPKA